MQKDQGMSPSRVVRGTLKRFINGPLRVFGFEVRRVVENGWWPSGGCGEKPYSENPEAGADNLRVKLARVAEGGPFEWPDIVALNRAVVRLIGDSKRIVELGGGTGCFAFEASANAEIQVTCSEYDKAASDWAVQNRSRPNIRYINGAVTSDQGPFDLLVSLEVIEHIADYRSFLEVCCDLAPRALLSTPNRCRSPEAHCAGPPGYYQHVREWSAGEFYWVLRTFYKEVRLYGMPDVYVPVVVPVNVDTRLTPLVAECLCPL